LLLGLVVEFGKLHLKRKTFFAEQRSLGIGFQIRTLFSSDAITSICDII
jgi:hypothetical protein